MQQMMGSGGMGGFPGVGGGGIPDMAQMMAAMGGGSGMGMPGGGGGMPDMATMQRMMAQMGGGGGGGGGMPDFVSSHPCCLA